MLALSIKLNMMTLRHLTFVSREDPLKLDLWSTEDLAQQYQMIQDIHMLSKLTTMDSARILGVEPKWIKKWVREAIHCRIM